MVIILVAASIMALIWGVVVWWLAPSEVTDPYVPEPLKIKARETPEEPPAEKKNSRPAKPIGEEPAGEEAKESNQTSLKPESNRTGQRENPPTNPSDQEESKPAEVVKSKTQLASDSVEQPEPPPDLSDAPTRATIAAEAIEDRDLKTKRAGRKNLMLQDGVPFTGWAKKTKSQGRFLEKLGQFRNGLKDGPHAIFQSGRKLTELTHYKEGEIHGIREVWYHSRKKKESTHYDNGVKHGASTTWYSSGKKKDIIHYEKGIKHGPTTTWFGSGKKSFDGHYRHGQKDGLWIRYAGSGKELSRQHYENGNPIN